MYQVCQTKSDVQPESEVKSILHRGTPNIGTEPTSQTDCVDEVQPKYEDNRITHRETSGDDTDTTIIEDMDTKPDPVFSDVTQPQQYPEYISEYDYAVYTAGDGSSERNIKSDNDNRMTSAGAHVDDVVSKDTGTPLSLASEYKSGYNSEECTALDGAERDIESDNDDRMTSAGKHVDDVESEHDNYMSSAGDHVDNVARKNNAPLSLLSHLIEIKPEPVDADDLVMDCCSANE